MPESDTSPVRSGRALWLLVALAVLTAALGVSVPLAPVHADQPVVSWPAAGRQAESTVLALAPYRPLSLEATVSCATLRELAGRPGAVDALRTVPPDAGPFDGPVGSGLRVTTDRGQVVVRSSAGTVLTEPVPAGDCRYQIVADGAGVRVLRDGVLVAARPDLLPPQVAELATEAPGAAGLSVVLRPDDRYASSPTALKTALLVAHLLALVALLALAVRSWPGRRPPGRPGLVVPRPSGADAVVVVVSAAWLVLGGVNWDDAWYLLMARNAGEAGYLGNYVYMFNAAENPFVASQYLLRGWGWASGWELAWMRLLPLAYGLGTWVLLRILLATALGRAGRLSRVVWLLMIAHLLWWLPYGMTLRPEPLIALCTAGVLVLVELARRRRSLGVLAVATALAALTLTVSPTGAVAWAPLVMALPWLIPLLRASGAVAGLAAVLVAGVAVSVVVPVGFADASLGEVLDAGATHNWYYLTHPWYEEILHYNALLTAETWGRRAPVVLTLAVLVLVAIASGRHRGAGDPLHRMLLTSTLTTAVALALIALSPTKWVNHFGALGAIGTVVLTAALLRSPLPRRSGAPRGAGPAGGAGAAPRTGATAGGAAAGGAGAARVGAVASGATVLTVVAAAALVYAGPNLWRPFSDWGQPFGDHLLPASALMAPHFGPIYLRNPLVWVALAALLAGGIAQWRRRGGRTGLTVDRGLLLVASGLSVALVVAVFVVAPLRQYPGWTVAKANLRALSGQPCGLVDAVQVLAPIGPQPVATGTALTSDDFALAAGSPAPVQPPADGLAIWHDVVPPGHAESARERGTLTTPWYSLPAGSPATHVTVPVAAGVIPGPQVQVQFGNLPFDSTQSGSVRSGRSQSGGGRSDDDQPRDDQPRDDPSRDDQGTAVRTVMLDLDPRTRPDTWQEIPIPWEGARPTAVRLLVNDDTTGEGSWVAVGAPSLTSWQPVGTVIDGRPVFADQLSAVLWPCVDQVAIRHGIVELPTVRLLTDDGVPEFVLHNSLDPLWGGTFVQAGRVSTNVAMATRLHPTGPPTHHWGQVQRVVYDHPLGLMDLHVATAVEPGWHREFPVTGDAYSGRKHLE